MILFILGALLGILGVGAVCVRYLRHEIAADIGPQLRHVHSKLDNLEAALNPALMSRYADISAAQVQPHHGLVLGPAPRSAGNQGGGARNAA